MAQRCLFPPDDGSDDDPWARAGPDDDSDSSTDDVMASQGNTEKRVENRSSTISYPGPSSPTPHPSIESDSYESKQGNVVTGYPESTTLTAKDSSAEREEEQGTSPAFQGGGTSSPGGREEAQRIDYGFEPLKTPHVPYPHNGGDSRDGEAQTGRSGPDGEYPPDGDTSGVRGQSQGKPSPFQEFLNRNAAKRSPSQHPGNVISPPSARASPSAFNLDSLPTLEHQEASPLRKKRKLDTEFPGMADGKKTGPAPWLQSDKDKIAAEKLEAEKVEAERVEAERVEAEQLQAEIDGIQAEIAKIDLETEEVRRKKAEALEFIEANKEKWEVMRRVHKTLETSTDAQMDDASKRSDILVAMARYAKNDQFQQEDMITDQMKVVRQTTRHLIQARALPEQNTICSGMMIWLPFSD